ncbi:SDR family oxidoreductase [Rhodococcus spongiicola]|uniref:SDR family oxidoreductase n=1 Tax=Rhodococcus spongiicola TaxID=2487352 RepID=A0A3S3E487_9NOCA|nr:SDR family oxidoreductase [Rhodococcus spongiicola]RVW04968.1 SDR family oxidoreductase [Rhodococcus spongiicola]
MIRQMLTSAALNPLPSPRALAARVLPGTGRSIADQRVLITGGSSGVGEAAARRLAELGAEVILVARGAEGLESVRDDIRAADGRAHAFPANLTDPDDVDRLVAQVLADIGPIDVLVNNAGRSIRRTVEDSLDRFHDFERTMAINYFGATRLTLALLPSMLERGDGHIVNVATWGVPSGVMPKFAAYHASKAAVEAFGRSLGAEVADRGIAVSTLHFPLVRTPMIAPTADYDTMPTLRPEEAAEWFVTAIRTRPVELMPTYAEALRVIGFFSPGLANALVLRGRI